MDVIYSHAVLTVVALSGLHANKNLPSIRPEIPQKSNWKLYKPSRFSASPAVRRQWLELAVRHIQRPSGRVHTKRVLPV